MLPAFHIHNLHVENRDAAHTATSLQAADSLARQTSKHGTLRLKAQEYDIVISLCKAAALLYIDEDDGELTEVRKARA